GAEIDLGLFARLGLEASHREVGPGPEAMDEASHAEIAARESVLRHQVLVDPLSREAEFDLARDRGSPGLAATRSFGIRGRGMDRPRRGVRSLVRAEGRRGWFCRVALGRGAEGRSGWFCRV